MGCQPASANRIHTESRAAVESIPAEPQNECAQTDEGHVVWGKVGLVCSEPASSRAEDDCTHESPNTTSHVHDAAACKVVVANVGDGIFTTVEPTGSTPSPVHHHWVDDCCQDNRIDCICMEVDALSHTPTDDGCSSSTERPLEEPRKRIVGRDMCTIGCHLLKEAVAEILLAASEGTWIFCISTISEHPAKGPPAQGTHSQVSQVLHQQVLGILGSTSPGLQHGKSSLHQHHQCTTEDQPHVVHCSSKVSKVVLYVTGQGRQIKDLEFALFIGLGHPGSAGHPPVWEDRARAALLRGQLSGNCLSRPQGLDLLF
mmetsp:Transcript_49313/g.90970  ORF Transcript_49313/g.90970 Transcript_49313/m.90970 type:complete len:315 (-) Transcript_49313:219-1163(-)